MEVFILDNLSNSSVFGDVDLDCCGSYVNVADDSVNPVSPINVTTIKDFVEIQDLSLLSECYKGFEKDCPSESMKMLIYDVNCLLKKGSISRPHGGIVSNLEFFIRDRLARVAVNSIDNNSIVK